VDKDSIEQSIEQCQHPAEGTHIHAVEQVRPQGMKNNGQNNEIRVSLSDNLINRITNPTNKTKTNFHYDRRRQEKFSY
jgi:hypothetical protein